jgi:RHS repeat-associated protein
MCLVSRGALQNNNFNEYFYFGGERVARRSSSDNVLYYMADHLGTARVIAKVISGQNTASMCYDADMEPYGGEHAYTNTCVQNYKFTGKERDPESGLDNFGARYYAPNTGRFMSADWALRPTAVPYAKFGDPQTLNLYTYVENSPMDRVDADGHGEKNLEEVRTGTPQNAATPGTCPNGGNNCPGAQNTANDNTKEGNTTVGALEKTMTNEVGSLSTPKKGNPDVLGDAKDALANTLINNANLDSPAKVAPATGTASTQDAQIMRDAATNRANGGADPVEGRTQFGTTHNAHIQSRSAMNHLKGAAGRETVYEKFGPFRDSVSRRPTWIVIYNDPGQ